MPLLAFARPDGEHRIVCEPAREIVISWNASGPLDLDVRVHRIDGMHSDWLGIVRRDPWRSCSPHDDIASVDVDTISADVAIAAVDVRIAGARALAIATPWHLPPVSPLARALTRVAVPCEMTVPAKSQYIGEERGWCGAASLAMVLGYWAQREMIADWDVDVAFTAEKIRDHGYGGTGNWTFAVAYASSLGLQGAVAYLRDLDHAQRLIAARIPLVLAIAWEVGELPGAPLPRSDGHLLVLRGFDREGRALVNDPALPGVVGSYSREALERVWLRAGGIAYAIAPENNDVLFALLAQP